MTLEEKAWIDNSTYEELLRRWRYAPVGDPIFQSEVGQYFKEVMFKKRDADPDEAVRASKRVGWVGALP